MTVTIIRPDDRKMEPVPGGSGIRLRVICDGRHGEPYVHVTEVPARHHIAAHSHSETEVTIVVSGTARVADTVCPAGSVIMIPANERYSLDAGDEPLTFVVVRPRKATYEFAES